MSCVALNWLRRKKNKKIMDETNTSSWTPEQYEIYIKQQINAREQWLKERNDCLAKLAAKDETNPLETYWNNKRPKNDNLTYPARPIANKSVNVNVDPRIFFMNEPSLPNLWKNDNDTTALECQKYVINNIKYVTDKTQFTINEEWLFPYETMNLKKGDCEDGAILMANLMLRAGIPYWRIRLNAGNVKVAPTAPSGGHAYITYLREKDNKWYLLDWCFFPVDNFGALFKDNERYYEIWFSCNKKYIYPSEQFERATNTGKKSKAKP